MSNVAFNFNFLVNVCFNKQRQLKEEVVATLKSCKRSLFILEEFDNDNEILHKLTEILKPFMDYTSGENEVDSRHAIFLILGYAIAYTLSSCVIHSNIDFDTKIF